MKNTVKKISLYFTTILTLSSCFSSQSFDDTPDDISKKESNLKEITSAIETLKNADNTVIEQMLDHADSRVRREAAIKMASLNTYTKSSITKLSSLAQNDKDYRVRTSAVNSLGQISTPDGVKAVVSAVCDKKPIVSTYAWKGIKRLGTQAHIEMLNTLGRNSEAATKKCEKTSNSSHSLKQEIINRLIEMKSDALPILTKGLELNDPSIANVCINLIGKLGHLGAPALYELTTLVYNSGEQTRLAAIKTISKIGDLHPLVMPTLFDAKQDSSKAVSHGATKAINTLRAASKQANRNSRKKPTRRRR